MSLFLSVALCACTESSTSTCEDSLCPSSKVCHEPLGICVDPAQLTVCEEQANGVRCDFPGSLNGRCEDGLCFDAVCGNGRVDFGEACGDGNSENFDGCSADCRSDETCGNGTIDAPREECDDGNLVDGDGCQATCLVARCGDSIVDPGEACDDGNLESDDGCNQQCLSDETCGNGFADFAQGEQCDDGGFENLDGCTSTCTAELPLWTESPLEEQPSRLGAKTAFQASTGTVILYGGTGPIGEPSPGTFGLRSDHWVQLDDVGLEPPPRAAHLMIYDTARRAVVVFGGTTPSPIEPGMMPGPPEPHRGDTWELGDDGWQEIATAISPSARVGVKGAWDPVREEIVVFGGRNDAGDALGDTWVYNGEWTQLAVSGPAARASHLMAYDVARDRTVLFGGTDSEDNDLTDTWEWDGASWQEVTTAVTVPEARGEMAYHGDVGVVAFSAVTEVSNATWSFDGVDWSEFLGERPPARMGTSLTYDPMRDALVMTGGGPGNNFRDTWLLDDTGWRQFEEAFAPDEREFGALAHDPFRAKTVLFGGAINGGAPVGFGDLWEWNGRRWVEVEDIGAPPPGPRVSGMVFDTARECFRMVRPGDVEIEVYELCGRTWTRVNASNAPPTRASPSITYDNERERLVLFGGANGPTHFGDTWELSGTTWAQVETDMSPPARQLGMLTFDKRMGHSVLFGGRNMAAFRDTWIYDGQNWTPIPTPDAPSPRFGFGLIYNEDGELPMIHGGDPGPIADTWEFDGATWSLVVEPQKPEPRPFPAIAYDSTRRRVVFAGRRPFDTWEFSYSSTTVDEVCSRGEDEDGDGLVDCEDLDCEGRACGPGAMRCTEGACVCLSDVETHCGDEFDGDCDGLVDCDDSDCAASADCTAESDCSDGIDDDGDGRTDCADVGCHGVGDCEPFEASCGDGIDNDGDGAVDCADADCYLEGCDEVLP